MTMTQANATRRVRTGRAFRATVALTAAAVLALSACSSKSGGGSGSGEDDPSTVNIGVGGTFSFTYLTTYIAQNRGFLAEALKPLGVSAKLTNFSGSVDATKAMLAGQTQYSASVASTMLSSDANGQSDIQAIAQFLDTDIVVMVARKGLSTDPKDLAHLKWGIASFGANNQVTAHAVLSSVGLDDKSVTLVAVGPPSAYQPAMSSKKIDVALPGEPIAETMLSSGQADLVLNLFDPSVGQKLYGGPYATSQLQATKDYIASHPKLTKAIVSAHVKALQWIQENAGDPDTIAAALPKEMQSDQITAVLKRMIPGMSKTGRVNPEALNNTIKAAKAAGTMDRTANFDLDRLINNIAFDS